MLDEGYLAEARRFAERHGLRLHLDGARLFNAAVAAGVPASRLARHADSVQFCLSKGLGAPVGSMVAGDAGFVAGVRRVRKMLGGGMRQAGLLAAAGIVALRTADRLAEDHEHARLLADGLADIPGIEIDPGRVQTNICMFRVVAPGWTLPGFLGSARDLGLSVAELGHGRVRAVTHAGVSTADVYEAVAVVAKVLDRGPSW